MSDLYETDFCARANKQAGLLCSGHVSSAGILNIAEEIESMGRSERNRLTDRLAVLLTHLLTWQFQPNLRGNSWRLTIREQRRRASRVLGQNPSLRDKLPAILAEAYGDALLAAERETGLAEATFPATCLAVRAGDGRGVLARDDRPMIPGRTGRPASWLRAFAVERRPIAARDAPGGPAGSETPRSHEAAKGRSRETNA